MTAEGIDWQELNAYVDGELPVERASVVADAIAADPALARRTAQLSRLKVAVAAPVELPDSLRLPPSRPHRRPPRSAIAAAVALLLLILGGAFWLQRGGAPETQSDWIDHAVALHHRLASLPTEDPAEPRPLPATAPALPGFPPDLDAARLVASPARPVELPGLGRGIAVQYLGSRGCRVSLIALDETDSSLPEALQSTARGELELFHWRVGAVAFLLLAEGMDPARLQTIAESVYRASRHFRPLDEAARLRLADARRHSAPCQA